VSGSVTIIPPVTGAAGLRPGGVVHTNPWAVELILDLAGYRPEANLVDAVAVEPAAGDGAFLVQMAERLIRSCRRQGRDPLDCADSLSAYELDAASAASARQAVLRKLSALGVDEDAALLLSRRWVGQGDFLLESARRLKPSGNLFSGDGDGANFVIGNPPYIRLEDIPADRNALYREAYQTMKGRADVYVAFFEAALRRLRPNGACAFICADRWMRNQYGGELRRLIASTFGVEAVVEMHEVDAFKTNVIAYPAITVIRRGPQRRAVVARAGAHVVETGAARVASSLLRYREEENTPAPSNGLRAYRSETWFSGREPWACASPERLRLLRRLERDFPPLESDVTGTKVGIGVATGLDDVYITRDPHAVEKSRLLPLALTSDIASGRLKWSGRYLINPWSESGLVNLEKFPRLKAYFEKHSKLIRKRNVSKRDAENWYRTIDRVNTRLTGRPKLYVPDIKNTIHAVLDEGATYPHHNLYFVVSDAWDLEALGALLMSDFGRFFVECYGVRMRGGYLRMQAQYLRRIRVPAPGDLGARQKKALAEAFRRRDARAATEAALEIYGVRHIPAED
jgi:adenine-specific DNA-methyltransferase